MKWIECNDWQSLPDGDWIVKIANDRKPYHVANVFTNPQSKVIIVGGAFYFDMGKLLAYSGFEKYEVNQQPAGQEIK